MPRLSLLLLGCVLITGVTAAAGPVPSFPGENNRWRHVESPNFEVYTLGSEREGRETLYRLELIRAVFFDVIKLPERVPVPVTVFRFNKQGIFDAYLPIHYAAGRKPSGVYLARPDRATVIIGPQGDAEESRHIVNHEFIHHLFRVTEEIPPVWYDEGMADLLATLDVKRGQIALGQPRENQVLYLRQQRMLPLEDLFAVTHASPIYTSGEHTGVFYAQSWALLHYLYFGESGLPREQVNQFLRVVRQSAVYEDPALMRAAVSELLGLSYEELTRRLERYLRTGRYRGGSLPLPAVPEASTYTVRQPSAQEMHLRLAELSLRMAGSPVGKLALLHAVEQHPDDARLHEVLGTAAMQEQDELTTRASWRRAIAAGSQNPAVHQQLAFLESNRWFASFDLGFRMRPEHAQDLRDLLQRSIEAAPNQSSAYEILAWVEGTAREPKLANVNLVQSKFSSLKNKPRVLLGLILTRLHTGDTATALKLLDDLDRMNPDDWVANGAERVRAHIEDRPPRPRPPRKATPRFVAPPIQIGPP